MRPIDPQRFLLVLAPDLDAEPQLRDQIERRWSNLSEAAVQRRDDHWAVLTHVFVGRRLGSRALVAEAQASSVEARSALIGAVGRALGAVSATTGVARVTGPSRARSLGP